MAHPHVALDVEGGRTREPAHQPDNAQHIQDTHVTDSFFFYTNERNIDPKNIVGHSEPKK